MFVIKRNGSKQILDLTKIKLAISKAFASLNIEVTENQLDTIICCLDLYEGISIEEIQDKVENAIIQSGYIEVAKAYITYRYRHSEDRDTKEKLKFLIEYCSAQNAASGSKFDANANVENKNLTTLMGELPKSNFIRLNRTLLLDKMKELYDKETADFYQFLLENHFIYKNDETSLANYCASITMYPWLISGTTPIGGNSKPPTNLKSFAGGFINMVFMVASMLSGAVATPEFLMYMDYFLRKEYGEDYYKTSTTIVDLSLKLRTIDKIITDIFEQIVYSINQPTGARNFQAVFWNISYYDKYYFESLFGEFRFPDGSEPIWNSVNWLQKRFMKWFNAERTKVPITFPVETMAMLTENNQPKDKEYGDFTAEMYAEGHSFFTYLSDSPDSLSSCCFSADTKVLWKTSNNGVQYTTFKEMHEQTPYKKNLRIFHNGFWVTGKSVRLPKRPMYKIETANNKIMILTDNHINPTYNGHKTTSELNISDYLEFNTQALQAIPENDENLTYEMGFIIGAFLGDGSFGSKVGKNKKIYEINFSQNVDKYELLQKTVNLANQQLGGDQQSYCGTIINNVYPIRISSRKLVKFIQKWTNWKEGTKAHSKQLNLQVLTQSIDFRKGILDGWYNTDGGNSNRCYTSSKVLKDHMELLITSLGLVSIINKSDRTEEPVTIRGKVYPRNYPLWCVRWYTPCNKKSIKDVYKWKNNSQYFKIKSIESIDYNEDYVYCIERKDPSDPYFTLPSGIITHNCRLRNEIQDNGFSYTLGAGGVSTGSKSVLTINLNRCIQYAEKEGIPYLEYLEKVVDLTHKAQVAYNENLKYFQEKGMVPLFDEGYINISRQYLTIGINGLVEAAEYFGIEIKDSPEYATFVENILSLIETYNKQYRTKELMFNCEMIPKSVGI